MHIDGQTRTSNLMTISYQDSFVFEVNERIAPFEVYKRLGVGAVGEIFLARKPDTEETLAIKSLKEDTTDHLLVQRFRLEYDLLKRLDHPTIARVFDYYDASRHFFTLEYVEGSTFKEEFDIKNIGESVRPDRLEHLVHITLQILSGLNYLHQNKVIHRDLKPENVMVTPDGQVKLLDFGVARFQESKLALTQHQEVIGTLEYMAPEMLTGKNYDHRIDIYSLGVMLYRVLTGKRLYEVYSFVDLFREKTTQESPKVAESLISEMPWLVESTNRMIMRDPLKRFRSAAEIISFFNLQVTTPRYETPSVRVGASPLLTIRNAPLLGRDEAFEEIGKWVVSRSSQPALVHGITGCGKSRFADSISRLCLEENFGAVVIQGEVLAQEEGNVLSAVVSLIGKDRTRDVGPGTHSSATLSPVEVTQLLAQRWHAPGVIIIDDIHQLRTDQHMELLDFFSSGQTRPGESDFLWLLMMNDDAESSTRIGGSLFADLLPHRVNVTIDPLSRSQVGDLVAYLMEGHEVEESLVDELAELSSGLPYSIANLLAVLLERELLVYRNGRWIFQRENESESVQFNITNVLIKQFELLSPGARDLLGLLACFGFQAGLEVLLKASQVVENDFDTFLNELILQDFVSLRQDLVVFSSARLQRYAYESLKNERRVELHRNALTSLVEHSQTHRDVRYLFAIVRHASVAQETAHVFKYSKEIALFFFEKDMYEESQQYLGNAIAFYEGPPRLSLFEAYLWKGEAELCLYRLQEASVDFRAALDVLEHVEVPPGEDVEVYRAMLKRLALHKLALIEVRKRRFANAQGYWKELETLMHGLRVPGSRRRDADHLVIDDKSWDDPQPSHIRCRESHQYARLVFDTLLDWDQHGDIVGRMAKRWKWDAQERTLTFELERGLKYHNGALVRADDVGFAIDQIKQQNYYNPLLTARAHRIASWRVVDSNSVEVTYADRLPPSYSFWCDLLVVPSYVYSHQVDPIDVPALNLLNGSGPFEVKALEGPVKRMVRRKRQESGLNRLDLINGENMQSSGRMSNGELDIAFMSLKKWHGLTPLVQVRDGVIRDFYVSNRVFRLCFKLSGDGPFDVVFRRTFYQCQLLEYWTSSLLRNEFTAVNGVPMESQSKTSAPSIVKQAGENLSALMHERGYTMVNELWMKDGEPFTIQILVPEIEQMRKCFEAMIQHWSRLGFKIKVAWKPMSIYHKYLEHPKVSAWIDVYYPEPDYGDLIDELHSTSASNIVRFQSQTMDELLEQLGRTPRQTRKQVILKINELFATQLPWLPLFQPKTYYAFNASLGGLVPSMKGIFSPPGGVDYVTTFESV